MQPLPRFQSLSITNHNLNEPSVAERTLSQERVSPGVRDLFIRYYPDYRPDQFFNLLLQHARPTDYVLEIGAGSGQNKQNHFELRDRVARYVGIDPDASVLSNPFLHESYQARAESLPFADATFDIVFHNYVAEHFESPGACNREIARVLKPGGLLLFQTPNRYYYACLAAQLTPQRFHEFFIKRMASGRSSNEVFPTFYRLNDASAIRKQLQDAGFAPPEIALISLPPGYLRFSKLTFLLGVFYERTLECLLPSLRGKIIVAATKQPAT
jgi:SAM-dependent methyltransferase